MPAYTAAFPCCRSHDLFGPVEKYGNGIRRNLADDAYWFRWDSTDDGSAAIRIARLGGDAMVFRVYHPCRFSKARRYHGPVSRSAWARLEDVVVESNFWMLDEHGGRRGLDGSTWYFAGRRQHDYHFVSRWSPKGALWDLGRLLFDLARLDAVRLY